MCGLLLAGAAYAAEIRLTTDGHLKQDPVFVGPAGEELLFTSQSRPGQLRLDLLKLATAEVTPLNPNETRTEFEPAVSRDGRWLAWVQNRGNLSLGMVIRDRVESHDFSVAAGGGFSGLRSPAFSPDASRVYYSLPEDGKQRIVSVTQEAKDRQTVIDGEGISNWPSVAPDGKQIVFSSTRDGNYDVYVASLDGKQVTRLTHDPRQDIRPQLSPDGKRVLFTSNRDGNYEIYVMRIDGTELRRVTENPERDDYASWHPDGRRAVFVGERAGHFDLYLIDVP